MKKSIIAGASVLALAGAVMPIAGVFAAADTEVTDKLQITVDPSCTFKVDATTDGKYTKDTLYQDTSVAGGTEAEFSVNQGKHDFELTCNDTDGFTVTAKPTNMISWNTQSDAAGTGDGVIAFTDYTTYSGNTGISGHTERNGYWTAHITTTDTSAEVTIADPASIVDPWTVIATKDNALGQFTFSSEYKVYAGTSTPADTYQGTIQYVLAAL